MQSDVYKRKKKVETKDKKEKEKKTKWLTKMELQMNSAKVL